MVRVIHNLGMCVIIIIAGRRRRGTSGEVACLSLEGGGGANTVTQTAALPHAHTHTNTHAVFLSEFCISLQGRMQDFGEEGVGST